MPYIDHANDPRRRAAAIAGVVAIHAALGVGLVVGLTVMGIEDEEERIISHAFTDPIPSPTPTPEPSPADQARPLDPPKAPLPPIPMPPRPVPSVEVFDPAEPLSDDVVRDPMPLPSPGPTVRATPTPPLPTPTFTPKRAAPANNPARWITTDDYPSRALRDQREGQASYRLVIGSDGEVSACEITASSGHTDLDRKTCGLLTRRARFEPATGDKGAVIMGTYAGTVRWEIPG